MALVPQGPEIDGVLDDAVWELATPIGPFTQVEPVEGGLPSRRTVVRLLTDRDNLYIGVRCYDDTPDEIVRFNMTRDGLIQAEDRISIVIDSFHDLRNGFFFQTNALGLRRDGLIENGRVKIEWDGIWNVASRIDEAGWVAEFVIPFKSLGFTAGNDVWGFNILRGVRGTEETLRWADPVLNHRFSEMSNVGLLVGMKDSRQGLGLDVVPSTTLTRVDDARQLDGDSGSRHYTRATPSLDVRYRLTPSLTATGTVNTDFGQTPVDDVRVNLSRFSLFFPEKREFFLQDSGIFDFANFTDDILPFFSRKIGLSEDGDPVSVRGGGKITGRLGPLTLGLLDTQVASQKHVGHEDDVDSKNLGVARAKLNVLEESTLGVIGTWGDPNSNNDHWLAGADFNYRNSEFNGNRVLAGNAWFQRSQCSGHERDEACSRGNAYGLSLSYPNDRIDWELAFNEIEANFDPALGRLRRGDLRRYRALWRYRWRPGGSVRTIDSGVFGVLITGSDDPSTVKTVFTRSSFFDLRTTAGDRLRLYIQPQFDRIEEDFNIFGDVVVPKGSFTYTSAGMTLEASASRPLSGVLELSGGQFFNGHRLQIQPRLNWRPNRYLLFAASLSQTWGWMEHVSSISCTDDEPPAKECGKTFIARVATLRFALQGSPDVAWNTLVQYENGGKEISLESRLRWTITPGSDLFLILRQTFLADDGHVKAARTQPLAKLTWTFRY